MTLEDEGAQEENEDPEVVQLEKEVAAEKEREQALKRREEAVARVAKEEQEKAEQAEEVNGHIERFLASPVRSDNISSERSVIPRR